MTMDNKKNNYLYKDCKKMWSTQKILKWGNIRWEKK